MQTRDYAKERQKNRELVNRLQGR
jgi:hypothetical protein